MKASITRGADFEGVLRYALSTHKAPDIIGGSMAGSDPGSLAEEFLETRQLRPEVYRPVWQCSLSLTQGEYADVGKWCVIADDFMSDMGLMPYQWVAVRHGDTAHDHIHIISSRISPSGAVWPGRWEARRAMRVTQELEQAHGLISTPGIDDVAASRGHLTKNEMEQYERTGSVPIRLQLQQCIDAHILDGPSLNVLRRRLNDLGVAMRIRKAEDGRIHGLSFGLHGVWFKGSQLGKRYSWPYLERSGVTAHDVASRSADYEDETGLHGSQ